ASGQKPAVVDTRMRFGGSESFSVTDVLSADGSQRTYELRVTDYSFALAAFESSRIAYNDASPTVLRLQAMKKPGYVAESYRYWRDETEIFGLSSFMTEFTDKLYTPFMVRGAKKFLENVTTKFFPKTERQANLATTSPFLMDM